jgi:hypothetical protein
LPPKLVYRSGKEDRDARPRLDLNHDHRPEPTYRKENRHARPRLDLMRIANEAKPVQGRAWVQHSILDPLPRPGNEYRHTGSQDPACGNNRGRRVAHGQGARENHGRPLA